jgi:hypothetical protein
MPRKPSDEVVPLDGIEDRIHTVRGQRVMLDADLALLYDVETRVLNQAVKRNLDRFPDDFAFQLTAQEVTNLKSQIVTSSLGHGGRRKRPWAFTEQGVAMLSSVLKSDRAVRVNIEIMRAFVRLRRLLATPGELIEQIRKLAETVELHDSHIRAIAETLRRMLEPPTETPKRRIGFRAPGDVDNSTPRSDSYLDEEAE